METKRIVALQRTTLFRSLTSEQVSDVAQRAVESHLRKGEILFLSGEEAKGLFVVVRGKIRAFQQDDDGREQVMHVDASGAVLGDVPVFDDGPYPVSAISESDADVLFIEKSDMRGLCVKYPSLALAALKLLAAKVRKHASLVETLSLHEVGQRLALFLLTEAQSASFSVHGPMSFRLDLSNHEIASRIGSVRDVVSRSLARLKHEGLIAMEDRDVTILDLQGLKRYVVNARNSGTSSRIDSIHPTV
ncbi:MAG: Crp/Fnr family transcriptional regulator [Alloacidobacterium sp.]|jgi:CRP-like cAMP-binding protein